jgi:hypothetical protein
MLVLWAVSMSSAAPPAPAAAPSLCDAGITVFTCETTTHKVLSICRSPDLSRSSGWAQYRFGRPGAIELSVPAVATAYDDAFHAVQLLYETGNHDDVVLHVPNAQVGYHVFEYAERDAAGKRTFEKAGVRVVEAGKTLATVTCGPLRSGTIRDLSGVDWGFEDATTRP